MIVLLLFLLTCGSTSYAQSTESCNVRSGATDSFVQATFGGSPRSTSGCVVSGNCNYEIHVLGNYESNGHTGFRVQNTGFTDVYLEVTGSSTRALILVLSSYEPVEWVLHIPVGVIIDRVILSSYLDSSIVSPPGQVLAVENTLRLFSYGSGGRTSQLLSNIQNRFGAITSLTGTYAADGWRVALNRGNLTCTTNTASAATPNTQPIAPSLRLVGGTNCQGRLEMRPGSFPELAFGQACASDVGRDEARVICRQLGCSSIAPLKVLASQYGFSSSVDIYRGFRYDCDGSESSLAACRQSASVCRQDNAANAIAVRCSDATTDTVPPVTVPATSTPSTLGSCQAASRCIGRSYCSGSFRIGATCVDGRCLCPSNPLRDRCTCLSTIGSCHIQRGATNTVGSAALRGAPQTGHYSCVANNNCDNEIHVIGNYESNGRTSVHGTGFTNLYLTVTGSSSMPLILVLSSYEHVQWTLHIPRGVVIDRVIISSYLNSSIVYQPGQVRYVENTLRISGYGSDSGGGHTEELLTNIVNRFGPVSSFTGTYGADQWRLTLNRRSPDSNCHQSPNDTSTVTVPATSTLGLRLVGGTSCQGRLEIRPRPSSEFGQACDLDITSNEAMVICRQLGCPTTGAQRVDANQYGFSPAVNVYRAFGYVCDGTERALSDCRVLGSVCTADSEAHAIAVRCSDATVSPTLSTVAVSQFTMSTISGSSVRPLSAAEAQCIQDQVTSPNADIETLTNCASSTSGVDTALFCRNTVCFRLFDQLFTLCGRGEFIDTVCGTSTSPSSTTSTPNGVWYGIGAGIVLLISAVILVVVLCSVRRIKHSSTQRTASSQRSASADASQRVQYNLGTYPVETAPPTYYPTQPNSEVVAYLSTAKTPSYLSTAEPPSYEEVQANKDGIALPPPYPGLD